MKALKHEINSLLDKRMQEYPYRGEAHSLLQSKISELTTFLKSTVYSDQEWNPSNIFMKNFDRIKDRPIIILSLIHI